MKHHRGCSNIHGRNDRLREAGFTLLELLISVTMILLIALITSGAIRLGFRSLTSAEKGINALERFRTSINVIDSQIQSEIPIGSEVEGDVEKVYFRGSSDAMEFPSSYSLWDGRQGNLLVHYKITQALDGKKRLSCSENTLGTTTKRETILFDAVDDIYFEYFSASVIETGSWVLNWTDETSVPEKIHFHLRYRGKDFSTVIPMRVKRTVKPISSGSGQSLDKGNAHAK